MKYAEQTDNNFSIFLFKKFRIFIYKLNEECVK
jgi:hypothetical protein